MSFLANLSTGFSIALSPINLVFALIGVLVGTVIGVLPGIGSVATVALLIPVTYGMNPSTALIMMAGVYYGAMYGGSTTSILINTPGEPSSVVTTLDGYPMAKQGRAGAALATAAIGSFVAGTLSTVLLMLIGPTIASVAIRFGPAEYFALMLLGLTTVSSLAGRSVIRALISMVLGLVIATIGIDIAGFPRFSFGFPELYEGIDFLIPAIGLFAITEVLEMAGTIRQTPPTHLTFQGRAWLTREEFRRSAGPWLRGSLLGFIVGVLPGAGATIASFLSYALEKRLSRHPEEFGKGAIEGVAGPEAANNGSVGGAMVPLLTLGIPGSGTTAILLGAFMMFGLQPGPLLFQQNPDVIWAVIASMYVGNVMLLVLNLPLIRVWIQLFRIPPAVLAAMVLVLSTIGVYAVNGRVFDLWLLLLFGALGWFMRRYDFPPAPMILALVLGKSLEDNFRRAVALSDGSLRIFVSQPLAAAILALCVLSLFSPYLQARLLRRGRLRHRTAAA
ncbi:tripartite tricarboxylate transporter permease [Caldinitratiruptor microaerophilus]|uniref:Tripartite tricarboxylate transporter TctA n=1 Tax=Caldinitratiruptor microaerophilus TaxID=671077 RepID=A0AA35G8P2_9FIRM|nr:tripartite tricarboxylate transporter permease [Caldinitratiruptor microaerophilus]BDG59464.1 tripartite tricarboxylate transporter TctA [Caldinitratiruptor microaerophilus]